MLGRAAAASRARVLGGGREPHHEQAMSVLLWEYSNDPSTICPV